MDVFVAAFVAEVNRPWRWLDCISLVVRMDRQTQFVSWYWGQGFRIGLVRNARG